MNIAVVGLQVAHYTGGRYLGYMAAVGLAEAGHEVTVYANRAIPFQSDFAGYKQPNVVVDRRVPSGGPIGPHEVYIGIPPYGSELACKMAQRRKASAIVYLFDVVPLMEKAGRRDVGMARAVYRGYRQWVQAVRAQVVVLADCTRKPAADWLGIPGSRIDAVYPGVNTKRIPSDLSPEQRQNRVVWVSRIVPHKQFPHFLEAVKPFQVGVDVISARAEPDLVRRYGLQDVVRFHTRIDDRQKFHIVSKAKVLIFSSNFEGFGMPVVEAWACATPVVSYSIPTVVEVAQPMAHVTYFGSIDERWELQHQVFKALSEDKAGHFPPDCRFTVERLGRDLARVCQKVT